MILKGLECSNCDETFEWISEATLHVCKEQTKYTCDFICNCPANDTAERVEREIREKVAVEIDARRTELAKRLATTTDVETSNVIRGKLAGLWDAIKIAKEETE